jgi:hypothetical protein
MKTMQFHSTVCRALFALAVALLWIALGSNPAEAVSKSWVAGSGNWNSTFAWTPPGPPGAGDSVSIGPFGDGVARTVTYNYTGPAIHLASLGVDLTGPGTAASTLSVSANDLRSTFAYIGYNGRGELDHNGGLNTIGAGGFLSIGTIAGSTGTYNLSGAATLTAFGSEYVGDAGTGFFHQSGGTNDLRAELRVGNQAGSTGTYTLSGGFISTAGETIGKSGTGTFDHTGGQNSIGYGGRIVVGSDAGSTGTYNLSGTGSLNAGHDLSLGEGGSGTMNQFGGASTVTYNLTLGLSAGSSGAYNLSEGTLVANTSSSYRTYIGVGGTGIFNQTGGTSAFWGDSGILLGSGSGSTGTFMLSGGSATVTNASMWVGGSASGPGGSGVLNVSDTGRLAVAGTLVAYNTPGTVINLSGGTIEAPALNFNGNPALLNWTGGKLHLTSNVTWDFAAASTTTSAAFGASRALGNNQTLMVTGNETLGGSGGFFLTLDSGSTHHVTGALTLQPTGTITQNAGSTLYAGSIIQAGGTVNGVLQNQTTFTYQSGLFNGRLLNQGVVNFGASFAADNGVENAAAMTVNFGQTLTVNGAGLDNQGEFSLAGGTLAGAGPLANNSVLTGHGTLSGSGGFINNGSATVSGGTMTVSNAGMNTNAGQFNIPGGQQLRLAGANFANSGTMYLGGGTVSGSATLNNTSGIISGRGTISSPLANAGTLAVDSGILNVMTAFTNSGEVYLGGGVATLSGSGAVNNAGLLRGDGIVNKAVNNDAAGEVRAESGKRIKFTAANGINAGQINLQGGATEFVQPLTNGPTGQIVGRGMLKVGGDGLTNNGHVALSGGIADVFGDVVNDTGSAAKGITVSGNADVIFWDDINNAAGSLFRVSGGSSVTFFGSFSGSGVTGTGDVYFEADVAPGFSPATIEFDGNVNLGSTATLEIELGGPIPGGDFDQVHVAGALSLDGTLEVSLIDGFAPELGHTFDVLDWNSLTGAFSTIVLPTLPGGRQWDASQLYTAGVLSVAPSLEADFDEDGDVDGDDLADWEAGFGTATAAMHMQGDADVDGDVDGADFLLWQRQLGSAGSLAGAATVPEPATLFMMVSGVLAILFQRCVNCRRVAPDQFEHGGVSDGTFTLGTCRRQHP